MDQAILVQTIKFYTEHNLQINLENFEFHVKCHAERIQQNCLHQDVHFTIFRSFFYFSRMSTFKPPHQDDAALHHDDFSSPNSPVSSVAGDVLPYIKRLSTSDSGRGSSASDSGGSQNGDPYAALPTLNGKVIGHVGHADIRFLEF